MARKIGFERPDTEPKKSIADSYLDEFRKKHNHKLSPNAQPTPKAAKVKRNWVVILFLSFWLTGWSIGIVTVLMLITSGSTDSFLFIWVGFALLGWFVAVYVLIQQIKGVKPFQKKSKR